MLDRRIRETRIICDKCGNTIRSDIHILSEKFIKKYSKKKTYCGRCIQLRLNRDNPEFDFDKEFSYQYSPIVQDELNSDLELLLSCMM